MYARFIFMLSITFLFCTCTNKKPHADSVPDTESERMHYISTDTALTVDADTIVDIQVDEPPLPTSRAEVFDDFIWSFASNKQFQKQRIAFPLMYCEHDDVTKIEKAHWTHDSLMLSEPYYTLLLNHKDELEGEYPDTLTSAYLEWISLKDCLVKRYFFKQAEGKWKLESIELQLEKNTLRSNFMNFFSKFAADSTFQVAHVRKPLLFVTADPDDDFNMIKTTLDEEQWLAFKPQLPTEKLFNMVYGTSENLNSKDKILELKGVGNGFANTLFFRYKQAEHWELYKFEDTSN